MKKATRQMLNQSEQAIVRLIESKKFAKLDEEELIELHTRTRRACNKYLTLRRRRGAAKVKKTGSRAVATKATVKTARKAEATKHHCTGTPLTIDRSGLEGQTLTVVDCRDRPVDAAQVALSVLARPWGAQKPAALPVLAHLAECR